MRLSSVSMGLMLLPCACAFMSPSGLASRPWTVRRFAAPLPSAEESAKALQEVRMMNNDDGDEIRRAL